MEIVRSDETIFDRFGSGGSNERNNLEIGSIILERLEKPRALSIKFVKDPATHDQRYSVDRMKVSGLGFTPRHGFMDAMHSTLDWYVTNRDWLERSRSSESWTFYKKVIRTIPNPTETSSRVENELQVGTKNSKMLDSTLNIC